MNYLIIRSLGHLARTRRADIRAPQIRSFSCATKHPYAHEQRNPFPRFSPTQLPSINQQDTKIAINWETNIQSKFHNIWLRDHCRCPQCFHPITKQRLMNTFQLPPAIKPVDVQALPQGLEVTWSSADSHKSVYPWTWLQQNSYDPKFDAGQDVDKISLWGSSIRKNPPTVQYDEVMSNDGKGLYQWLSHVHEHGFCFVYGVPATPEATEELSRRIGFIRETQYGQFWDFTSDLAKGDTAYTTLALGAHTDNTYFTDPCGLQLFHLLSHTEGTGGATLLVDGFYVASLIKEKHPNAYALLSNTPIPAHAAGEPSSIYCPSPSSGYPVLGHDLATGKLTTVRWNNDDRSVMKHVAPHLVEEWYDAISTWYKYLTSPECEYWVQLNPGTAVVIDNHRVLHGRSAFDGKRRMCGAYIGIDEYHSKLATLREKFNPTAYATTSKHTINGRSIWHPAL
ncbi:Trimethyllysine dioxygenase [Pleurotus eryngii]|uniref:trimethyllysine dioxygenase n=1 Tax=Pleurotus eryngii TaxID=5323 RepID=A0A9P5ZT06_PLEER|nr:Trimethyllysine dioxygenase [Pleurotus eryngii]